MRNSIRRWAGQFLVAGSVLSVSALADVMYLKLDGIAGESADNKHAREIEVESYSWGISSSGAKSAGSASGAATIDQFVISKRVDSASPHLFRAALTGARLKSANFVVVRAAGRANNEYIRITLEDVSVVSVKSSGAQSGPPHEQITFNFRKASYSYAPMKPDGTAGTPIQVDLDPSKK